MATCHSLRSVDDELVGDPLDLKMFEFTNWSFEEGNQGGGNIEDEEQGTLHPSIARPPSAKDQSNGSGASGAQNVPSYLFSSRVLLPG
jgi:cation-transporting ATPase 13A3/4/5